MVDGGIYALFDFVEGTNYSLSFFLPAHRAILMRAAGQTLARLHHALNGFAPQGKHHLGFESQTGNWQRGLPWYTAKVEELKEKSRGLEDEQEKACADWIVQKSAYVLEELGELDVSLRNASLPRLIIHGDFGLHNLVFPKVGPAVIMDYETARLEWRLSDLVSALSRLRYADGTYNFRSIQSFLGGYQSVFPIDTDEWQLLPSVWRFYKLRSALIYWNSFFETGGPVRKMHSARDAVWQADWVLQHPHELSGLSALSPA
jgi:Ser/Thr protein kinase RdoA (MazF antagonist)